MITTDRKVLLIAGGGTLGTYTARELLKLGVSVDVICLEDKASDDPALNYIKADVTYEYLTEFLNSRHYDGIVNFMLYRSLESYIPTHTLLSGKTDHLIFVSSYRVYAESDRPLTESSLRLYDTVTDTDFLENENYAVPKSKCEDYIANVGNTDNWTVIRPVISFSHRRFDVATSSGRTVVDCAENGRAVLLPEPMKNLTAGLDWAGNSGKLIAHLLFKQNTMKRCFTVSSAQNLKWCDIADIYSKLLGVRFEWVDLDEVIKLSPNLQRDRWILKYDRLFDRVIDNSAILNVTGLSRNDFTSIEDGIKIELTNLRNEENK